MEEDREGREESKEERERRRRRRDEGGHTGKESSALQTVWPTCSIINWYLNANITFVLWIQSVFYHDKNLSQKKRKQTETEKVGEKEGEEEEEKRRRRDVRHWESPAWLLFL